MTAYLQACRALSLSPQTWLVTGAAGFIGSHLVEALLTLGQKVTALDNFSTGSCENLESVHASVGEEAWGRLELIEGTVASLADCKRAAKGVNIVLHEAGFISVPLSMEDPLGCHEANVTGMLNLLVAAKEAGVSRFVYASSSAVYGDDETMPKVESVIGAPLSPYGASKLFDEIYASLYARQFGLATVGLRYFNIFGPRQNPTGGYAAVIPQWIATLLRGEACQIHGDGSQTRDFCHVQNVVQANILAGIAQTPEAAGNVFNVALGLRTSLNELHEIISAKLREIRPEAILHPVQYGERRPGDIVHSGADISRIEKVLGYAPEVSLPKGLEETVRWYAARSR